MPRRDHPDFGGNPIPNIPSADSYPDGRAYSLTTSPPGISVSHKTQTETNIAIPDASDAYLRNERSTVKALASNNKNTPQRQGRPV